MTLSSLLEQKIPFFVTEKRKTKQYKVIMTNLNSFGNTSSAIYMCGNWIELEEFLKKYRIAN